MSACDYPWERWDGNLFAFLYYLFLFIFYSNFTVSFIQWQRCHSWMFLLIFLLYFTLEEVSEGPVADGGGSPVPNLPSFPEPPLPSVGLQSPGNRKAHWQVQLHPCVCACVCDHQSQKFSGRLLRRQNFNEVDSIAISWLTFEKTNNAFVSKNQAILSFVRFLC